MLRIADFAPLLNQTFHIPLPDETLQFVLTEVSDLGHGVDNDHTRRAFSLLFRHARRDAYLPQGTYLLRHADLGDLHLFLVPLGPRADGTYYESIFT